MLKNQSAVTSPKIHNQRSLPYDVRKARKRVNVTSTYRSQWLKLHRYGVVEVLMNKNERNQAPSKVYAEILKEWPIERIKALSTAPGLSVHKLAGVLGITRRTLRFLIDGTYTPSPTLCRRMEMLEGDVRDGKELGTDILPARSEMRRRLLLFRSWWMNQPPSVALPEVTVSIRVKWGTGNLQTVEIPTKLLPKLRINSFASLVTTVRAVTTAMREVTKTYSKMLWRQQEEEFWLAYSTDTLPEIVKKRAAIPASGIHGRKWRPSKNASKHG